MPDDVGAFPIIVYLSLNLRVRAECLRWWGYKKIDVKFVLKYKYVLIHLWYADC